MKRSAFTTVVMSGLGGIREYPSWKVDLLAAHWVLGEVANGGLTQFFLNGTGVVAPEAVAGFRQMRLPEVADTLEEAMRLFGPAYPRDRDERKAALAKKTGHTPDDANWDPYGPDHFEALDNKLFELGGTLFDKLYDVMDAYAKERAA